MAWLALPPCASGISSVVLVGSFVLTVHRRGATLVPCWAWLALPTCPSGIPRAPVMFLFPAMYAGEAHAMRHWQTPRADGPKREELTEGAAMISGLGTSPIHFPDFEKKLHLRADLPHTWVFPEQSCRRNQNPSNFENNVFLREMLNWYCPTPPNLFSDGRTMSFFG